MDPGLRSLAAIRHKSALYQLTLSSDALEAVFFGHGYSTVFLFYCPIISINVIIAKPYARTSQSHSHKHP